MVQKYKVGNSFRDKVYFWV